MKVSGVPTVPENTAAAADAPQPRTIVILLPSTGIHALYIGRGESFTLHRHYASQVSISLSAPLKVRTRASGPYSEQSSFIVGPNIPHQVEATDIPCFVLWSESRTLADLAYRLSAASKSELPDLPDDLLKDIRPVLQNGFGQATDAAAGRTLLSDVLKKLIGPAWDERPADERIAAAASLLTPQFLIDESEPIAVLAKSVHLSPSRFRHLFRGEMGLSVQSYVRWRRLTAALQATSRGASLTEAAHRVGFADSAHLTRVFRATFGISPSRIFKNSRSVQVISEPES